MLRFITVLLLFVSGMACTGAPQHVGSTMLNFQPPPPSYLGQLDFDLMESSRGSACANLTGDHFTASNSNDVVIYWTELPLASTAPSQVRGLIAAAALDAIEKSPHADTMIITRVVTEAKGHDETCAYVYGRGVRLKKAALPEDDAAGKPGATHDETDDSSDERH